MNPDKFIEELSKHNIDLTEKQKKQFQLYFEDLIETNKHVNLTRITEEKDVYLKHFYDSITPLFEFGDVFKENMTLCDVGAGAGFPSIPMPLIPSRGTQLFVGARGTANLEGNGSKRKKSRRTK